MPYTCSVNALSKTLLHMFCQPTLSTHSLIPTYQPDLSIHQQNTHFPLCNFKWLAITNPDHSKLGMSEYSDFYAGSTKLMHFVPYKLQKAFSPPTAIIFHQASGFVVTAVGSKILKYDIATGSFLGYFTDLDEADITALCEDGLRGRRLLCGNEKGKYYLINFTDGSVIDELKVHTKGIVNEMKIHTMEVTIQHNRILSTQSYQPVLSTHVAHTL